jgi:hypothetical protein
MSIHIIDMSVYTLKRKTDAQYNNNSVGYRQFSINGTRRSNSSYIHDSLSTSKSQVRNLCKSGQINPIGYGGCCNTYRRQNYCTNGLNDLNNPSVVKSSVLSNYGSIATHFRWITRPQPFTTVKPDSNANLLKNNSQGAYIQYLDQQTILAVNTCNAKNPNAPIGDADSPSYENCNASYKDYQKKPLCPAITKQVGPIDESLYILQLDNACSEETVFSVGFQVQGQPFQGSQVWY